MPAFQTFPSVRTSEIDTTNTVPALSTTIGGFAGHFNWGPAGKLVQIGSETDLVKIFGKPTGLATGSFATAASFLKFGSALQVSRALPASAFNAIGNAPSTFSPPRRIANSDVFDSISGSNIAACFFARSAGAMGNSLSVTIAWSENSYSGDIARAFDYAPGSTEYAEKFPSGTLGPLLDEIHVLVIDKGGLFTGVKGTILEKFQGLSLASDAKTSGGASNFYRDVINAGSSYIFVNSVRNLIVNADLPIVSAADQHPGYSLVFTHAGVEDAYAYATLPSAVTSTTTTTIPGQDPIVVVTEIPNSFRIAAMGATLSQKAGNNIQISVVKSSSVVGAATASFEILDIANGFINVTLNLATETYGATTRSITTVADLITAIQSAPTFAYNSVDYPLDTFINIHYLNPADADAVYLVSDECTQFNLTNGGIAPVGTVIVTDLTFGSDGNVDDAEVVTALSLFEENTGTTLLFAENFYQNGNYAGSQQQTVDNALLAIVHARMNCVAFISAPLDVATTTSKVDQLARNLDKFDKIGSTSYAVFDQTPLYVYNKYTDKYVWIPACGQVAGLCAWTAFVSEAWNSPAGLNRGQLLDVTRIAYNPSEADQATLYKARINSILSIPGEGIVLFGDKTAQTKASAFDRINVRFLFIVLKTEIAKMARYQLFELNDEFTRAIFTNAVNPYLRSVKGRRGISDHKLVCDSNNNTPEVIDSNGFVGDIYVKPMRSINFIQLNFIATRTGVEFTEIVGSSTNA